MVQWRSQTLATVMSQCRLQVVLISPLYKCIYREFNTNEIKIRKKM